MHDAADPNQGTATAKDKALGTGGGNAGEVGKDLVTISVNGTPVSIHRGHQTVAQIKTAGKVALADDLEQLIDKRLVPLADGGAVTIKGNEVFVSHPKDSSSSHPALFGWRANTADVER